MKILFCGTAVPETIEYQVKNISAAGNRFQNNMIHTLKALGHEVNTVSYVAMEIPKALREELENRDSAIGNKTDQRYIFRDNSGGKATLQAMERCKGIVKKLLPEYDVVISYNVFYSFLFLPKLASKFGKKNILILADYSKPECFQNLKSKWYAKIQKQVIRQYGTVVGLSGNVRENIKPEQRFVLMEGGIDEIFYNQFSERNVKKEQVITFMYSGLLSKVTGVDILLKVVMEMNDKRFRLWISGKGDLENQVCEASEKDERIRYLGHMKYEDYIRALKSADVLINPRNMGMPENQNNFPSKIMDYLASGKEILSSKFAGWEKFAENITFYDDIDMLKQEIMKYIHGEYKIGNAYEKNRKLAATYLWENQIERILGND